jgi:hypothetical protein
MVTRTSLDRESSGRARGEGHLRDRARLKRLLDVVAVKVHGQRLVRAPFELHHVVLLDADKPHVVGDAAVRNGQRVGHLGGVGDG